MASLTIKNIPEDLLKRLRVKAASDRRSLTKEVVHLLETVLGRENADAAVVASRALADLWSLERRVFVTNNTLKSSLKQCDL